MPQNIAERVQSVLSKLNSTTNEIADTIEFAVDHTEMDADIRSQLTDRVVILRAIGVEGVLQPGDIDIDSINEPYYEGLVESTD